MTKVSSSAYKLFRHAHDQDITIAYRGPFMEDLTTKFVGISENTIHDNQGLPKINRKVSFLLVESFQNILRHGAHENIVTDEVNDGLFCFRNINDAYIINSINPIRNDEIEQLQNTVEYINSLDSVSLKKEYLKQLQSNEFSEKGGAGLGLIEIARKSGQKLNYEIEKISDDLSLFHQQILFLNDSKSAINQMDFLEDTKRLYETMIKKDILLEYKGDFSQKSILPIFNIVENNFASKQKRPLMKKVGHVLIEVLQNISKHAYSKDKNKEGIFLIGNNKDGIYIQSGNLILRENKVDLDSRMNDLILLSKDDLAKIHRVRIKESINYISKTSAGLGLIEIARACSDKIGYRFDEFDEEQLFFSLYVKVE